MGNTANTDKKFLDLAIRLAEKARGFTSPNPLVGAVITKAGNIVSTGYHKRAGGPHAEIEAIESARSKGIDDFTDCNMYVSLEPCSIFAKTPPCTDEIIRLAFNSVIIASRDPNPLINGKGVSKLLDAGISVREGLYKERVQKQNEVFFKNVMESRPFITAKIASSIDAKLATRTASSKWITSEDSRKYVKKIRSYNDCIITGINTVLQDDPMLGLEKNIPDHKKWMRVILDSNLKIPVDSKIVSTAAKTKTLVFFSKDFNDKNKKARMLEDKGVLTVQVPCCDLKNMKGLSLDRVTSILFDDFGISSALIEAGPRLTTNYLKSGSIDKFYFFLAPKIIGGDSDFNMFEGIGVEDISDAVKIEFDRIEMISGDLLITAYPQNSY